MSENGREGGTRRSTVPVALGGALVGGLIAYAAAWPLTQLEGSLVDVGGVRGVAFLGAVAGSFVAWAWRRVSVEEARSWAQRRGAEDLGDDATDLVRRFIRRSRGARTLAVAPTLWLGMYAMTVGNALGGPGIGDADLAYAAASWLRPPQVALLYVLAALFVETRRRGEARGAAVLAPRDVTDYVNPFARWVQHAILALAVLVALLWVVSPGDRSPVAVLGVIGSVVAASGAVQWGQRRLVARGQRYRDPDVLRADDLARASTAHALTGGLVGFSAPMLGGVLADAIVTWSGPPRMLAIVVGGLLHVGGIGLWAGFGTSYASTVTRPGIRDAGAAVSS